MSDYVTKKELEETLDDKSSKYQSVILNAVSIGFEEARQGRNEMKRDIVEIKREIVDIKESINNLTNTLDVFLKRLTNHEEEFTILKA